MALHESDRENLLREATALFKRAEFRLAEEPEPVTIGFRRDGALSLFFGPDPVFQFNSAGEIRRAFVGGLLYKAENGKFVELRRERSRSEVLLVRRTLDEAAERELLTAAASRCDVVLASLASGEMEMLGQVPADANVATLALAWRQNHPGTFVIAARPHAT